MLLDDMLLEIVYILQSEEKRSEKTQKDYK